MAEAKKENSKDWKKAYRDMMSTMRSWLTTPWAHYIQGVSVVFLLFACVLLCVVAWKYSLRVNNNDLGFDVLLKDSIENNTWINILLMIGVILMTLLSSIYVAIRRPRWYHLPLYPILPIFMLTVPKWYSVQTTISALTYPVLLTCCLGVMFLSETIVLTLNFITRIRLKTMSSGNNGFVAKTEDVKRVKTGWDSYIDTILSLIGEQQLKEESFAIGISGKWGSGKTTFYNVLKDKIKENGQFLLCEYKPWQIIEPSRMATDFFAEFADVVSEGEVAKGRQLRRSILKYASLLTAVPYVKDYVGSIQSFVESDDNESISSIREIIEEALNDKYIVVMIDDLDRLNKEELLEIMRLVRASANFKHVLFVLTYDKGYFARILGKTHGVEYLKKIVNVEIVLPMVEQYKYGQLLMQSVCSIFNESVTDDVDTKKEILQAINSLDNIISEEDSLAEKSLLYKQLHNFRDIKRFANQLGLVLRHLAQSGVLHDFYFSDLFWIEVIHYTQEDIYNKLQFNFSDYLAIKNEDKNPMVLVPAAGTTEPLLKKIFVENSNNHPINSIIWTNHYYGYFAHRRLEDTISSTEFKLLLNGNNSGKVLETISGWLTGERKRDSLQQLIKAFPMHSKFENRTEADNYTHILMNLLSRLKYSESVKYNDSIPAKMFKHKYHRAYFTKINNYSPFVIISDFLTNQPDIRWNSVLTAMCLPLDEELKSEGIDAPGLAELQYVLSKDDLAFLAETNYTLYFEGVDMPIEELFKQGSKYMNFVLSLSYVAETIGYKPKREVYDNLIGKYLIKRFDETIKKKLGDKEFGIIHANLLDLANINPEMDEEEATTKLINTIHKVLGTKENFEQLIQRHFELGYENYRLCSDLSLQIVPKDSKPVKTWNGMSGGM